MNDLGDIFAEDGPLAKVLPGYRMRAQQLDMARSIERAIAENQTLIVEAGTGTGKTMAYLVPALRCAGKVIISTGTKTLQDQLFNRDLPAARRALGAPIEVALLKGRANYICHYHLEKTVADGRLASRADVHYLREIRSFTQITDSGDKASLPSVPEEASVWNLVTSTRDNCLGQDCEFHSQCFVMRARKAALTADLVVVNHHLFFADVMLRDEDVAELLPSCNAVIFDEAHQLPEVATQFFGASVSTGQFVELARDTRIEKARAAADFAALDGEIDGLDRAARELRMAVGEVSGRQTLAQIERHPGFAVALDALIQQAESFAALLETQRERGEGLQKCWERAEALRAKLLHWKDPAAGDMVRWGEAYSQSIQLNVTPIHVADDFRRQLQAYPRAWIFTSATLAVRGNFAHYQDEMGLEHATTFAWDSPFDYGIQGLLYVPTELPDPNDPQYTEAVVRAAMPVIRASGGRAFMLFTSLKAMREGHALLTTLLEAEKVDIPVLLQGERPRSEQLERFRKLGNAVLLGSQSFWEGVDVKGDALSVVIIDRLPFAPPDDPVLAARVDAINRAGRNAFMEYQLPQAIITLKQGAGRLIRDEADRGVLMICDPRLIAKSYGRRIWQSLPPMRRTRNLADVEAFFAVQSTLEAAE